jgi:phosphonate transport system substrate-binding protein
MALENGQFDAAIVEVGGGDPIHGFTTGPVYTMARRGLVDPKDFRTIWVVGPIPNSAIVTRIDRPQPFIDIVRGAMAALPYDEPDLWRDVGQPDGSALTAVDRSFYADVIKLRADDLASRRGGHPRDGKPS